MQTVFTGQAGTMRELEYRVVVEFQTNNWPDPVRYLDGIRTELGTGPAVETELSQ